MGSEQQLLEDDWQHQLAPKNVYKYRSLNENLKYLEALIIGRQCYFSEATGFNDPFDCLVTFSSDCTLEQFRASAYGQLCEAKGPLTDENWQQAYERRHQLLKERRSSLERHLADTGVFCVSATSVSTLMWSHYADSHKGICLEFDTQQGGSASLFNSKYLRRVEYKKDTPVYRAFHDTPSDLARSSIFRKSIDWRYEEEWRVTMSGGAKKVKPYPEGALVGIILGLKTPNEGKQLVEEWRNKLEKRPDLYQVKIQQGTYKLVVEPVGDGK